ncbi:putative fluoride ion transporter CrcB [Roseibium aquae]|uniref:Fluoride-specific ion channel FluC n=1 Tax=Roseibium aquae TaxID=1323746 RepID=A0A916TLV0_9HYPH|nr:fluoride efflux transporter CrcB [Roseibium aquae]GGB58247.1 putative fluoride ion transporter CrcB [Roseibium aquae]
MTLPHLLLVMLGGGLGAGARYLVSAATLRVFGPGFPVGTLAVNVIGSLLMGILIGWLVRHDASHASTLRSFLATGVLGGFTTFSAFSLDTAVLWERGEITLAMIYIAVSVLLSITAVFAGLALMRSLSA